MVRVKKTLAKFTEPTCPTKAASPWTWKQRTRLLSSSETVSSKEYSPTLWDCILARALPTATGLTACKLKTHSFYNTETKYEFIFKFLHLNIFQWYIFPKS